MSFTRREEIALQIIFWTPIILFICVILFAFVSLLDSLTIENTGEVKSIRCVDERGNKFVDEMCEKKITCSKLGLAGTKKCSEEKK